MRDPEQIDLEEAIAASLGKEADGMSSVLIGQRGAAPGLAAGRSRAGATPPPGALPQPEMEEFKRSVDVVMERCQELHSSLSFFETFVTKNDNTMKHIAYYRVSTQSQGRSGLGLDAQRHTVAEHISRVGGQLVGEFTEIETGKRADRPELAKALARARETGSVLIIAKLDRLARNARFLLSVIEGVGEAGVHFCDLPHLPAGPVGKFMLTQMAAVAELEAGLISQRTKAALAQAKARGVKLGNPQGLTVSRPDLGRAAKAAKADAFADRARPHIAALRAEGLTLAQVAARLNELHCRTARGSSWTPTAVKRVIDRGGSE